MKKQHFAALALLLTAGLIIAGCGGGGGTTPSPVTTIGLSGRILGPGGGVAGATVTASAATKAVIQTTTNTYGYYTFDSIPAGSVVTITITGGGLSTTTFTDLPVDAVGSSGAANMDLYISPSPPATGSTVRIDPRPTTITAGGSDLRALVNNSYVTYASWIVVGDAQGHFNLNDPSIFEVQATKDNGQARITMACRLANGTIVRDAITVTTDTEGTDFPPMPF